MEVVLHKVDAFARNGVGDDDHRFFNDGFGHIHGVNNRFNVVTVNLQHVPVKRFPFVAQVVERHHHFGGAVNLNIIAVDNDDHIRQLVLGGQHNSFPVVAFVQFAVANGYIYPSVLLVIHAHGQRHSGRLAEAGA